MLGRGHEIQVVTDSGVVSRGQHTPDCLEAERVLPGLVVHQTTIQSTDYSDLRRTALVNLGWQVMESFGPDVIVGWYLWPYAAAAAQLGLTNKIPVFAVHAGSDLALLRDDAARRSEFLSLVSTLRGIATTQYAEPLFRELVATHIPKERVRVLANYPLGNAFNTTFVDLNIQSYLDFSTGLSDCFQLETPFRKKITELNRKPFTSSGMVLTLYGSLSRYKCIDTLLIALSRVIEHMNFSFLSVVGGDSDSVRKHIQFIHENSRLSDHCWLLPPLPLWRIPSLLRLSDVVFSLEDGFPIPWHSSRIPHEVFQMGAALVATKESIAKLAFRDALQDGMNYFMVQRPSDPSHLADLIDQIVGSVQRVREVATRGRLLYRSLLPNHLNQHPLGDWIERTVV